MCVFVSVCVCVWQERKPEKSVVRPKLSERSLNLQPFRTHTHPHTHISTPHLHNPEEREPCVEEGSWNWLGVRLQDLCYICKLGKYI